MKLNYLAGSHPRPPYARPCGRTSCDCRKSPVLSVSPRSHCLNRDQTSSESARADCPMSRARLQDVRHEGYVPRCALFAPVRRQHAAQQDFRLIGCCGSLSSRAATTARSHSAPTRARDPDNEQRYCSYTDIELGIEARDARIDGCAGIERLRRLQWCCEKNQCRAEQPAHASGLHHVGEATL